MIYPQGETKKKISPTICPRFEGAFALRNRPRPVWNFVRRVGQRFSGGLWIWTSGQNQLQSNFNLSDYLFIKIPKMNVKDTVQENNSKIEKNELTFMTLKWLIQIIRTRRKLDFQIF